MNDVITVCYHPQVVRIKVMHKISEYYLGLNLTMDYHSVKLVSISTLPRHLCKLIPPVRVCLYIPK
jgi:hypothetical protein